MIKKWKNKLAEKAGFTLVELIVVIAILGILAAIAVPTYTGYIARANNAKVLSELSTIVTAAQSAAAINGENVSKIQVAIDGTITLTTDGSDTEASDIAEFASNVSASGTSGKINNWSQVLKGSQYEGKVMTWNVAGAGSDAAWSAS